MIMAAAELLDFHPTLRRIRNQGACRDTEDPDEFFPSRHENSPRIIKKFCRHCPVQTDCLQWAVEQREEGVWGGMTDEQRKKLRRLA